MPLKNFLLKSMLYKKDRIMNEQCIWTMWWQGEQNAPVLVKKCINSMREKSAGRKVIVITEENYLQYIELPDYILEKVKKRIITITHLSDLIRMELIYRYGGIWIDSTIFINYEIPSEIYELDFYTIKRKYNPAYMSRNVSKARWSSYLIGGKKGCRICSLIKILLHSYWKQESTIIAYFLVDYFLDEVISRDREARKLLDAVPYYENDIFFMNRIMNKTADREIRDEVEKQIGIFNKLSWKATYNCRNKNDEKTFFGIWINDDISNEIQLQKVEGKELKLSKIKRYFKESFDKLKIKRFGIKLCILSFGRLLIQARHGKIPDLIDKKYNIKVKNYLRKYSDKLDNMSSSL